MSIDLTITMYIVWDNDNGSGIQLGTELDGGAGLPGDDITFLDMGGGNTRYGLPQESSVTRAFSDISVSAGDRIWLQLDSNGSNRGDHVSADFVISYNDVRSGGPSIPMPGLAAVFAAGLIPLVLRRRL